MASALSSLGGLRPAGLSAVGLWYLSLTPFGGAQLSTILGVEVMLLLEEMAWSLCSELWFCLLVREVVLVLIRSSVGMSFHSLLLAIARCF